MFYSPTRWDGQTNLTWVTGYIVGADPGGTDTSPILRLVVQALQNAPVTSLQK